MQSEEISSVANAQTWFDWPKYSAMVLVASDGSSDPTAEIAQLASTLGGHGVFELCG
jgi:hypothetical protein